MKNRLCEGCFIKFVIMEEKIFWNSKLFHYRCLIMELKKIKGIKIFILNKDPGPLNVFGLYNVFEYKSQK
jgi:spore maturation protein CgeB